MSIKVKEGSKVFNVINIIFMIALIIVCLYPIWYVLVASFSNTAAISKHAGRLLWPKGFTVMAYKKALSHPLILKGFRNIFEILLFSLPLNMLFTLITGYFMASKNMLFKKGIMIIFMIPMFFGGGLIPTFLNMKSLGLYNNIWALIIPGALSIYNAIICKTAIEGVPDSLIESAYMDGAGEWTIIAKILVPLIKPTLAVLLLYYGVGHWNSWFEASIYIKDTQLLPIQNVLRNILLANSQVLGVPQGNNLTNDYVEAMKYAVVIVSTVPILCIYPFLQKYFVKGVMVGAVKG